MATISFTQNVTISDKKVIEQITNDLIKPTFDISKLKETPSAQLPKGANEIWFKNSEK